MVHTHHLPDNGSQSRRFKTQVFRGEIAHISQPERKAQEKRPPFQPHECWFKARITLVFDTWQRVAMSRKVRPSVRSSRIFAAETGIRGRPNRLPFARALRRPARTRSTMMERSSSDTAPKSVKTILPIGVDVSTCSERLTNSTPKARNVSSARNKCDTERAKRSNLHTTTASNSRRWASAIKRSNAGLLSLAPLM